MLTQGEEESNRLPRYNRAIHAFNDLAQSDSAYQEALASAYTGEPKLILWQFSGVSQNLANAVHLQLESGWVKLESRCAAKSVRVRAATRPGRDGL